MSRKPAKPIFTDAGLGQAREFTQNLVALLQRVVSAHGLAVGRSERADCLASGEMFCITVNDKLSTLSSAELIAFTTERLRDWLALPEGDALTGAGKITLPWQHEGAEVCFDLPAGVRGAINVPPELWRSSYSVKVLVQAIFWMSIAVRGNDREMLTASVAGPYVGEGHFVSQFTDFGLLMDFRVGSFAPIVFDPVSLAYTNQLADFLRKVDIERDLVKTVFDEASSVARLFRSKVRAYGERLKGGIVTSMTLNQRVYGSTLCLHSLQQRSLLLQTKIVRWLQRFDSVLQTLERGDKVADEDWQQLKSCLLFDVGDKAAIDVTADTIKDIYQQQTEYLMQQVLPKIAGLQLPVFQAILSDLAAPASDSRARGWAGVPKSMWTMMPDSEQIQLRTIYQLDQDVCRKLNSLASERVLACMSMADRVASESRAESSDQHGRRRAIASGLHMDFNKYVKKSGFGGHDVDKRKVLAKLVPILDEVHADPDDATAWTKLYAQLVLANLDHALILSNKGISFGASGRLLLSALETVAAVIENLSVVNRRSTIAIAHEFAQTPPTAREPVARREAAGESVAALMVTLRADLSAPPAVVAAEEPVEKGRIVSVCH